VGFRWLGLEEPLEPIESALDEIAVVLHPSIEIAEGLRAEGVESPLALGSDLNEPAFVQDPQMSRDPGLAHRERRDERSDRALATPQLLHDAETRRVRKDLEGQARRGHGP